MAVVAGMADVVTRVRALIGDPAGADQVFSTDEVQDALNRRRVNVRYLCLEPVPTITGGGGTSYLQYVAPWGDWQGPVTVQDGSYDTLTPSASDLVTGTWDFSTHQPGPVFVTGYRHDCHGAAADLADAWAAKLKLEVDYDNAGLSNTWMHKAAGLRALADRLRQQAETGSSRMVPGQ